MVIGHRVQYNAQQFRCRIPSSESRELRIEQETIAPLKFTYDFGHFFISSERIRFISSIPGRKTNTVGLAIPF